MAVSEAKRTYDREYGQRRRARLLAQGLTSAGTSPRKRHGANGWPQILEQAAAIVRSYDTGVMLRQLFYRLVSVQVLRNRQSEYQHLSNRTAIARREGWFPALIDRTSQIEVPASWDSPRAIVEQARLQYRRDRTEGQDYAVWLIVEKAGLLEQLSQWFGHLGLPMAALSGYASQTDVDTIIETIEEDGRPAVLLYGGDFDPTGEDILRDFTERTGCWAEVIRVALNADQVEEYNLPENPGKDKDSRNAGFIARHGRLVQVEIDALDPNDLRDLFQAKVDAFFDRSAYDAVMEIEDRERKAIVFLDGEASA